MVRTTLSSIKNILVKEQHEIISAVSMLMALSIITKVSGMVFLTLVARQFGASTETDNFYLASVIPETITNIILLGAISGAIIPIFVNIKEKQGAEKFVRAFSSTMNMAIISFIVLSILAALFSRQLVPFAVGLVGRSDSLSVDQVNQIVWMMRILLIPQIILGLSAFVSTGLNIYHRFIIPQLAPLFFNIGKIIGVLVFVPLMNGDIMGLVVGTFLGALMHLLIQLPLLSHLKIGFKLFFIDLKDRSFKQVIKLGTPRIFSLAVEQIAAIVDSIIAFGLTAGSLTAYQLAVRLISIPMSLFGTTYSIAAFPTLSALYGKGKSAEFSLLVNKILNQVFFLAIPVTVMLMVLRIPIVRLVYGILGGNFSWEDTLKVAWVVLFFSLGLSFETLRGALFRVFYAMHDSVTPMISSFIVVILGIVSGIMFTNYFSNLSEFSLQSLKFDLNYFFVKGSGLPGVGGLALSSSTVFSLEFFFLIYILHKREVLGDTAKLFREVAKKFLAGFIMLIIAYAMLKLWDEILDTARTVPLLVLTLTTIVSATMLYIWTSFVLNIPEVELFIDFLSRNFRRFMRK